MACLIEACMDAIVSSVEGSQDDLIHYTLEPIHLKAVMDQKQPGNLALLCRYPVAGPFLFFVMAGLEPTTHAPP
jgi:hypothetical protein